MMYLSIKKLIKVDFLNTNLLWSYLVKHTITSNHIINKLVKTRSYNVENGNGYDD